MYKKYLVVAVFAALIAFPAAPAQASTAAELQSQIRALMAQIIELQRQLALLKEAPSKTPKPSDYCPRLTRDLYFGNTDAQTDGEVSELQKFLGIPPNGYFGVVTQQAIRNWQRKYGITTNDNTGTVGPITRAKILSLCRDTDTEDRKRVSGSITGGTFATENPIITGTARGTNTVGLAIGNGDKVYGSGDIAVRNGTWSHKVSTDLNDGTYTVYLYVNNIEVDRETIRIQTEAAADPRAARMAVMVGVYEGSYPKGVSHSFGYHPEGTVTVTLQGKSTDSAQPLLLTSYEPVNWVINNPHNVPLTRIITVGYHQQRVTNAPAGVPVSDYSGPGYPYAYEYQSTNYHRLVDWLEQEFGYYSSGVFYGSYSGSTFNVALGYKA